MFKTLFSLILAAVGVCAPQLMCAAEFCQEPCLTPCPPACYGYGMNPVAPLSCCEASTEFDLLFLKTYVGTYGTFYAPFRPSLLNEASPNALIPSGNSVDGGLRKNTTDWDYGFRFAISKRFCGVPFVTSLSWMHFRTEWCKEIGLNKTVPTTNLIVENGQVVTSTPSSTLFTEQKIHFNLVGLCIDREVLSGPYFTLKPGLGLDYINLNRHSYLSFDNVILESVNEDFGISGNEFFTQIRGLGPFISLASSFLTDCGIYFDGILKAGLIWTQNHVKDTNASNSTGLGRSGFEDLFYDHKHHLLTPEINLNLCVGWSSDPCDKDLIFSAHIGWQALFLFGLEETAIKAGYGRTFNLQGWNIGASVAF